MRRYHYRRHHIPSNRVGEGSIWLPSRDALRRKLREWTRRGIWKYREA